MIRCWLACFILFAGTAEATSLTIVGTSTYLITGSNVQFQSTVQNSTSSNSAVIRMELWVFTAPYSGGSLSNGHKLSDEGTFASSLGAGLRRTHVNFGPFTEPPYALWNVTLIWTEQDGFAGNGGFSPRAFQTLDVRQFGFLAAPSAPPTPTGLTARAVGPTEIVLRWNASSNSTGRAATYRLYESGGFIGAVTSASASVSNLSVGTTHSYAVSACDAGQNCSVVSDAVTVTTLPNGSPSLANFTGQWWNSAESGWGINLNHQGNTVFAALYTYDSLGKPLWVVMPSGAMQSGATIYSGALYEVMGSPFNVNPFIPSTAANVTQVGTMTVSFSTSVTGTLSYTINGIAVQKEIRKQIFGSRVASCIETTANRSALTNYQDLWWNPAESGWGLNITHQDETIFATLFIYGLDGKRLWVVMSNGEKQADGSYLGGLYETTGPAFNANPFTPIGPANVAQVGTLQLRFSNGVTGTLVYTINGMTVTKTITRQEFASPPPGCTS